MAESLGKSPPDVVSSSNTWTGLDKLRSIFKSNSGSGDSVPTPKKTVHFQIPPDIKELYSGDPKLENYVLEQMQEEEQKREAQLAKVVQQKKAWAAEITLQWINKLEEEKKKEQEEAECICLQKEKEEAQPHAQEEEKQAKILKKKQLEDEIRKKVLAEKKQKETEAAAKEVARLEKLEKFQIENQIHAEQGMELLIIPPELLDKSVPSEIKSPEEIKKENHIQKVPLETLTKLSGSNQETASNQNFSTPPTKTFVSVAESVKRKIIPDDGETPLKKAKKTTKSGAATKKEFAALILSPSKRKAHNTIMQAENDYKMLCKQKQKLMVQADSFLNMEHGEWELDAIYTRLFEHGYELEKEELVDIKDDSFFRILKYNFEDLVEKHEEEVVEIICWRLSTFIGDNLTTWSCVSTFLETEIGLLFQVDVMCKEM